MPVEILKKWILGLSQKILISINSTKDIIIKKS